MSPLTPAEAIAVAAILDAHAHALPHWRTWADRLRTWARTELPTEHEGDEA